MTLILSVITERYAVQASDRRLTKPSGAIFEDEENKTIIFEGVATISYTGLARLGHRPTVDWAIETLSSGDFPALFAQFPGRATRRFERIPRPPRISSNDWRRIKRTSFVTAGFAGISNAPPAAVLVQGWTPFITVISNAEAPDGSWASHSESSFGIHMKVLNKGAGFLLQTSGQPLGEDPQKRLCRAIRACLHRTKGPEPVARLLARAIRGAAQSNPAVGSSVTVNILPRPPMSPADFAGQPNFSFWGGGFPLAGPLDESRLFKAHGTGRNDPRYIYYPGDPSYRRHHGPSYVGGGLVIQSIAAE